MKLIIGCFQPNYVIFSGRAQRKEFWLFYLAWFVLMGIAIVIDLFLSVFGVAVGVAYWFNIGLFCPYLAVSSRRLHDTNRKAWWLLMNLLPVIGWIGLWVLFCFKGTEGDNGFGPDPLAPEKDSVSANIET